jgi:hypothetical protein
VILILVSGILLAKCEMYVKIIFYVSLSLAINNEIPAKNGRRKQNMKNAGRGTKLFWCPASALHYKKCIR